MAINPISLAESLRPLRAAGISCFLDVVFSGSDAFVDEAASLDSPTKTSTSLSSDSIASERRLPAKAANDAAGKQGVHRGQQPAPRPGAQGQERDAHSMPSEQEIRRASPLHASGQQRDTVVSANIKPLSLAPASWPLPWRELLGEVKAAPVLWSYAELGLDLSGQGNSGRSSALRHIIGSLQLPRGTSVFWPQYLPDDQKETEPTDNAENLSPLRYFSSGLELLAPKTVILLGCSEALAQELGFSNIAPYSQGIVKGRLYIHLPGMDQLLVDPQLVERACIFLRNALTAYPSLFMQK